MKAPNLLALSAAVLLSVGSLATFQHSVGFHGPSQIEGISVVDLAPVTVTASAKERRDALLWTAGADLDTSVAAVAAVNLAPVTITPTTEERVSAFLFADDPAAMGMIESAARPTQNRVIGPQVAMPYYSFGNAAGFISKE